MIINYLILAGKIIVMAVAIGIVAFVLSKIFSSIHTKSRHTNTWFSVLASLIRYAAAIIILCAGLAMLGVNVSTIVATVGVVALIVGFGCESLIEDSITGLFLLFEGQYNVGDIIEINGFRGTVKSIGVRTTVITDVSNNEKIINNSDMRNILNRSQAPSNAVCDISVSYNTDLEALEAQLPAILHDIFQNQKPKKDGNKVLLEDPVYAGVQELADSAIVLRFTALVNEGDIYSGARLMNHDLYLALRKENVEIPFPQMDVHTK